MQLRTQASPSLTASLPMPKCGAPTFGGHGAIGLIEEGSAARKDRDHRGYKGPPGTSRCQRVCQPKCHRFGVSHHTH